MPQKFVIPQLVFPYLVGRKWHAAKIRDGFENKTWTEYFTFIINKLDITLQPTIGTATQAGTESLFPMWMNSFAENLSAIREETAHSIRELASPEVTDAPEHSAVVVGRGPSVFNHKHLKLLSEAKKKGEYEGLIIATDGMLIECLKHDIFPDLTVSVDGSPLIKKWYNDDLVNQQELKVVLPVTIDNSVYKTCVERGCKVHWFIPQFDMYYAKESITKVMRAMTKTPKDPDGLIMVGLGGNAGTAAWVFGSFILKCSPIALIGIDFGYPEGTKLIDTPYYSSLISKPIDVTAAYGEFYHPVFKTKAQIDDVFLHYREVFLELQAASQAWYLKAGGTINCTEGGTLWGQNIKCLRFTEFLSKYRR